ncbi:MAG: cache domain-containing protein, partial [Gammaproteobacteria bacterium]|nr:cache domain-containing protein [Gammaproteobacteria bacterium]
MTAVSVFSYAVGVKYMTRAAMEQLEATTKAKAIAVNNWLEEEKHLVELLAKLIMDKESHHLKVLLGSTQSGKSFKAAHDAIAAYLANVTTIIPDISRVSVLSTIGGRTIVSTKASAEGMYHLADSFFNLGKEKTYVQKIYYSKRSRQPVMIVATPLKDEKDRVLGVLFTHLNSDYLSKIVTEASSNSATGETYLIDGKRNFVSQARFGDVEYPADVDSHGIRSALEGESGSDEYLNYRSVPVVGYYYWLEEPRVAFISEISTDEVLKPMRQMGMWITLGTLMLAFLFSAISYILSRRITIPITDLVKTTNQVSRGNLLVHAVESDKDEVGALGGAFNRMIRELQSYQYEMEYKIELRTKRLEHLALLGEKFNSILHESQLLATFIVEVQTNFQYSNVGIFHLEEIGGSLQRLKPDGNSVSREQAEDDFDSTIAHAVSNAMQSMACVLVSRSQPVDTFKHLGATPIVLGDSGEIYGVLCCEVAEDRSL